MVKQRIENHSRTKRKPSVRQFENRAYTWASLITDYTKTRQVMKRQQKLMNTQTTAVLPRTSPEAQGVHSAAIQNFIAATAQQQLELHSLMLLRHGNVIAEGWWAPYGPDVPHLLHSVSKSFTSTAIGLAVSEGRLSIDDPVVSFFPEAASAVVSESLAALRVRHLLSMSTGQVTDSSLNRHNNPDPDWISVFLRTPFSHAPGTHFMYNSGASYMLSAIIQKVTGQRLIDYLRPRLFDPLGIDGQWDVSPQGINMGGWGLSVTTEAIARFGQLYLQQGQWNGQQILPAAWIALATARHIDNAETPFNPDSDWQQGYGFQFWRCRFDSFRGDGAFGQFCLVMPDKQAVIAITASVEDMQAVLNLVWVHLRAGMVDAALSPSPDADRLRDTLSHLHIDPPKEPTLSPLARSQSGMRYQLAANPLGLSNLQIDFEATSARIRLGTAAGDHVFVCSYGESNQWAMGTLPLFPHSPKVAASGRWTRADRFEITLRYYETTIIYTLCCQFSNGKIVLSIESRYRLLMTQYEIMGTQSA